MFGYIKINNDELKGKYLRLYKEYYCALCTQLKMEFGTTYRILTNYDITFFLVLFDYFDKEKSETPIICPLNNKKNKIIHISKSALNYSTLINLFWVVEKLKDDINDDRKNYLRLVSKIIQKNKSVAKKYKDNELFFKWAIKLQEFYEAEKSNNSFDFLTNLIGDIYGTVFEDYSSYANIELNKNTSYEFGYLLGKYIYTMDAFDDYFDDVKKSRFNPIMKIYSYDQIKDDTTKLCFRIETIISFVVQEINNLFTNSFVNNCESYFIIENIVRYGLIDRLIAIKSEKYSMGDEK